MKNFYLDEKFIDNSLFRIGWRKSKDCNCGRFDGNSVRKYLNTVLLKILREDHLLPEKGDTIYISGVNGFGEEFSFNCKQVDDVKTTVEFYYDKNTNTGRQSYSILLMFVIE